MKEAFLYTLLITVFLGQYILRSKHYLIQIRGVANCFKFYSILHHCIIHTFNAEAYIVQWKQHVGFGGHVMKGFLKASKYVF